MVGGDWFIKEKIKEIINNQSVEWSPVNKVYKYSPRVRFLPVNKSKISMIKGK